MLNNIVSILGNGGGAANSYESIATVTVGAGGSSTITFSSIPSTYKHLQIRGIAREQSGGFDQIYLQLNSDTGTNYAKHQLYGDGTSAGASGNATQDNISVSANPGPNQTSNVFSGFVIDLLDYTNTNKYKTVRSLGGADSNGTGYVWYASGLWQNTNAVNSVKLYPSGGGTAFVQYSSFALYGVKG